VIVTAVLHIHANVFIHGKKIFERLAAAAEVKQLPFQLRDMFFDVFKIGTPDKEKRVGKNAEKTGLKTFLFQIISQVVVHCFPVK
jgi:hypothetical protein